nr:transposase [Enterococcus faecium]
MEQVIVVIPEYQCLTSIPGVGKVYAAGLIAEIGQIERFEDQTKLAKYAGLSWKVNQSGNYQSQNTPLTKQGNRYFRYYLVEAANSVKNYLPEYKAYRLGALAQESINVVLSVLVREIRALEKNIKELDKAIEQVIVVIPEYQCLTSIPDANP